MPKKTIEVLTAQLSVDLRRYERGFQRAQKTTDKRLLAMEKRFDKGVDKMAKSGDRMAAGFNRAIASIGVGLAIREATQLSDAWTEATNKIKAAEISFGGSLNSVSEIAVIASDTRSDLSATVELYSRFARAGGILGKSQEDVAKATEVANKAFKAGGAAASEQRAAILQLSQGLQSGFLAGDELRSVRENAPLVAEAIADVFGVTIGQLKAIGAEGKITSDIVFDALVEGAEKIERQYDVTTRTISDSFTELRTKGAEFVATNEAISGSAEALSGFIVAVANNLDLLADAAVVAAAAVGGTLAGKAMVALVTQLTAANLLLVGASGNFARVTAASILASKAVTRFNKALAFVGGPYALLIGGIALAILAVVKASKDAAKQEAELNLKRARAIESTRRLNEELDEYERLQREGGDATDTAAGKIEDLGKKYETTAEAVERLNKAEKNRKVQDQQAKINDLRDVIAETEKAIPRSQRSGGQGTRRDTSRTRELRKRLVELNGEIKEAEAALIRLFKADESALSKDSGADAFVKEQEAARSLIASENEKAAIRARGDKAEIQALEDKKFLHEQIAKLRETGLSEEDATNQAASALKKIQDARKAAENAKSAPRQQKDEVKTEEEAKKLELDRERLDLANRLNLARAAGNEAEIAALERQLEISRLTAEFEAAGFVTTGAQSARIQVEALEKAREIRAERERVAALSERQLETDIQAAAIRGDGSEVERLARIIELRERESDLRALGLSDTEAKARAEEEQRQIAIATAIAEKNYELERELDFKLLLAQESGNTAEEERLQREIDLLRTKQDLIQRGRTPDQADREAQDQQIEIDKAHLEGQIRDVAKGGFRAAIDGEFGDYLKDKLSSAADSMFDRAIDNLLDSLFSQIDLGGLFGGGGAGGGLGGIFAGLFDKGGNIKRGQFGIVGEKGPEIVQGPAHITGRVDTARLMRSRPDQRSLQPAGMSGGIVQHMSFQISGVDTQAAFAYADEKAQQAERSASSKIRPEYNRIRKEQEQGLY